MNACALTDVEGPARCAPCRGPPQRERQESAREMRRGQKKSQRLQTASRAQAAARVVKSQMHASAANTPPTARVHTHDEGERAPTAARRWARQSIGATHRGDARAQRLRAGARQSRKTLAAMQRIRQHSGAAAAKNHQQQQGTCELTACELTACRTDCMHIRAMGTHTAHVPAHVQAARGMGHPACTDARPAS